MKKKAFSLLSRSVLQPWFRLTRGLTLGVRAVAFNAGGEVLLVRHSYAPGWMFPGGGVERGETVETALCRELEEEAGLVQCGDMELLGLFSNDEHFSGDHIALIRIGAFRAEKRASSLEIAESGFFPVSKLPDGTTGGTRRRLEEIAQGKPHPSIW